VGSLTRHGLRQSSHERFTVADTGAVGAVRRAVCGYASRLSDDASFAAVAARVATELATNLLRHARPGGWMLVRPLPPDGVEMLAVDSGPGIRDVAAAVAGRAPSPNGLGCGLAAVCSASSVFDVYSRRDRGTVVLAVVQAGRSRSRPARPARRWAGISIGIDEACGDGWAVVEEAGELTVVVVDGLGHGIHASIAADAALGALADSPTGLDGYLAHANAAMRHTRGAALAVGRLSAGGEELRCLSIGNIGGSLVHRGAQRSIVAVNGTVGLREVPPVSKIRSYAWAADGTLVMWTDGLPSHIDLAAEAELLTHDPAVVAAALHRDHTRERDDATVVVVRNQVVP